MFIATVTKNCSAPGHIGCVSGLQYLDSPDTCITVPEMKTCTTVILLVVRVPVLSEQIEVAFPMVSQASRWRTKLLSCIIFWKDDKMGFNFT